MANDKNNMEKPRRDRINLSELYEVQDWSKKFSVNTKDLRRAVTEVWNNFKDFEVYSQKRQLKEI
jgi:hypothetical protein